MTTRLFLLVLPLAISACAVQKTTPPTEATSRIGEAVTAPLADLNLLRTKIPPVLLEAQKAPYRQLEKTTCEAISADVRTLDEALGPDMDIPPAPDPGMMERGTTTAGDAAIDALKGAAVGWIPYRSWVRKLTGAEQHSKEVATAIKAGIIRRAYLKGIGQTHGCKAPAAPLILNMPDQNISPSPR